MKKILLLITFACLSLIITAQSTRVYNYDLTIKTTTPTLKLDGVNGTFLMDGATSGTVTLKPAAVAGGTLILPVSAGTDTLSTRAYARSVGGGVGSMVYPDAGIALSSGAAWGTSITNNSTNWNTAYSDRLKWDGGSTDLVAATGRTSLGGTTAGQAFFTLPNPSAITFLRINADNTVSALSATDFRTATSTVSTTQLGAKLDTAKFHTGGSTGSITLVGNDAITLTTTGATSLTLPTTGTVVVEDTLAYYATLASPTLTGTTTTNNLHIDGSAQFGNTGLTIDSIGLVDSRIAFYDGADTLGVHIIASDIEDLGDVAILLGDTLYSNNPAYYTQRQVDSLAATISGTSIDDVRDEINDSLDVMRPTVRMLVDTIPFFVFGGGGGNATDTTVFTTSTIYGSFYNVGSDTLVVTELRCVMGHGIGTDTLSVDILWDVNNNDATPTELNTNPLGILSTTSGTVDTSFNSAKIPPGVWVWCETPGVVVGRKPTYFIAQISGYKIPKY